MVNATLERYLISFSCIPTMVKMLNLRIFYHTHTHQKKKEKKWRKEQKGISTKCNVGSFWKPGLNKSTVKGRF